MVHLGKVGRMVTGNKEKKSELLHSYFVLYVLFTKGEKSNLAYRKRHYGEQKKNADHKR